MAQNFRRYVARQVGTSAVTLFTADSFDTIVGIALANVTSSEIKVDVILNDADSSNDVYLIKNAPIIDGQMPLMLVEVKLIRSMILVMLVIQIHKMVNY